MANEAPGIVADYPLVSVHGSPYERGVQYGMLARERIQGSLQFYAKTFQKALDVEWSWVRQRAGTFSDAIEAFSEEIVKEMRGLAEGADVEYEDVLCLNCRSEVLNAAAVLKATGRRGRFACECSGFAAEGSATANGSVIVGQNWDYISGCEENVVLLSVERDDGPNYVTLLEAGLLGKMGMNEAGVTLTTNGLVTSRDLGEEGLPFHVVLRALLDSPTVADGVARVRQMTRSGSGNYTLASAAGLALNIETAPGGPQDMAVESPEAGLLAHTNHFVSNQFLCRSPDDYSALMREEASTVPRLNHLREFMRQHSGRIDRELMQSILADHSGRPLCLCVHEDLDLPPFERWGTRACMIMEPASRGIWLAAGNPCVAPFRQLDTSVLGAGAAESPHTERPVEASAVPVGT
jgi:isopenicillin-N N-acyltransferase like protein